jgi:hypothetical protein
LFLGVVVCIKQLVESEEISTLYCMQRIWGFGAVLGFELRVFGS